MATPTPLDAQKFGVGLVTLAGMTLGIAPKTPAPGLDRTGDQLKSTLTNRGGWDGNSNEPLLADDQG